MTKQINQAGFTLIELLLYVGLSAVLLVSASVFMGLMLESRVKHQTITEIESQGAQVMRAITQSIRNAEGVSAPGAGSVSDSLVLDVLNAAGDPIIFDESGGLVRITEGAASPVALTNSRVRTSSLTFQNLSRLGTPGIIRVQFTLSYINSSGRNEFNYAKTFVSSAALRQP